jgi:hypothetical protein
MIVDYYQDVDERGLTRMEGSLILDFGLRIGVRAGFGTEPAVVGGGFCQESKLSRVLSFPSNSRYDWERSGVSDRQIRGFRPANQVDWPLL